LFKQKKRELWVASGKKSKDLRKNPGGQPKKLTGSEADNLRHPRKKENIASQGIRLFDSTGHEQKDNVNKVGQKEGRSGGGGLRRFLQYGSIPENIVENQTGAHGSIGAPALNRKFGRLDAP